jgi:hypothetical protein
MGETVEQLLALASRPVSTSVREQYASKGWAMPDGSFPIPNKDFLRRAVQSFGRAPEASKPAVKAHIIRRAKALGALSDLPEDWGVKDGDADQDDQ